MTGRPVYMWMNGGGTATSNPFDVVHVDHRTPKTRGARSATSASATRCSRRCTTPVQLTYIGGVDRFQFEGNQYSPNFLQFEAADGFLGTSQVNTTDSRYINQSFNAVWTFNPGLEVAELGADVGRRHVRDAERTTTTSSGSAV